MLKKYLLLSRKVNKRGRDRTHTWTQGAGFQHPVSGRPTTLKRRIHSLLQGTGDPGGSSLQETTTQVTQSTDHEKLEEVPRVVRPRSPHLVVEPQLRRSTH